MPVSNTVVVDDQPFFFTGRVGSHNQTGQDMFLFADEFNVAQVWADANGTVICEL